ncbi:MAG: D-2-hydroxyacid dehydrogenase [Streptosporangiaceae bacterium]
MAVDVVIATPLEDELVDRIRREVPEAHVSFDPTLMPTPRYPCDHRGDPHFSRSEDDERRWWKLLATAEVLFGLPGDTGRGLARIVRASSRLRWVQATAAGAGEQIREADLSAPERDRVCVTSAAGIHAGPLAEFALLGILTFTKDLPRLRRYQRERRWDHSPVRELRGSTLLVLGVGGIGLEVARLARSFGMYVLGVKRVPDAAPCVDEMHTVDALPDLAPRADAVVCTLPITEETRGVVSAEVIAALPPHCVFVNVGRGRVVDESALTEALASGRLAGAALDVFATEPLPAESPLWELDNVVVSSHTAALSPHENTRIVDLFIDNLRRYVLGKPLRNRVDTTYFY